MSWKIGFLVGLMGCAPDTVAPGAQDLGDFERLGEWKRDLNRPPSH